ncbi:nucleolar transcription factor 1-B-like [Lates japonicus]
MSETEESEWTKENFQKLFAAMKNNIPKRYRMFAYSKAQKALDWKKVAFPPFSPEECQEKWGEILQKMRKFRSLTELIVEAEDALSEPKQNNKIHPKFPKRPTPPNALFYKENRAKFQEQHPELSHREVLEVLGKKYPALPDEEKTPYKERHQLAVKEYKAKVQEFRKQFSSPPDRKRRKPRKRKQVSADTPDGEQHTEGAEDLPPKPPLNGYNLFCKEQIASMAGISVKDYVIVWAQRWRDLTMREKNKYNTRCEELKRQYAIKLNEYLQSYTEEEQQRILNENGIKIPKQRKGIQSEIKPVFTHPGEPKMPSRSGNVIFYKAQMELLKEEFPNSKERFLKVCQSWQGLSIREKERYREKAHERLRKYSTELQKWFKTLTAAEQEDYIACNPSKRQYLDAKKIIVCNIGEPYLSIPSDSEDEDIEDSSSDEEEVTLNSLNYCEDEEEEEEEDDITFEMF